MEQRKEIVRRFVSSGLAVSKAVLISGLSKSSYYYRPNGKMKGKRASTSTLLGEQLVSNDHVIATINDILMDEFIDYGYQNIHQVLRKQGFRINHKKVYRLMKENHLLHPKRNSISRRRTFVKFTSPPHVHPFATMEIDIKFIYIHGIRRHAYLATVFDTFTRMAIDWDIGYQMKNTSIAKLIRRVMTNEMVKPYVQKSTLRIRSDNGPQFISLQLNKVLAGLPVDHEFIRPATPQQNGHIESFHNTLQKLVLDKYELADIEEAKEILTKFYHTYNHIRIMKSILHCSPVEFLKNWETGKVAIGERDRKQFFFRERQSP
jgi:putative transposase